MADCCPTCGRRLPAPKTSPASDRELSGAELDRLGKDALYAYYKRRAPLADINFTLRHARLSAELRDRFVALRAEAGRLPRAEFYRRYNELRDAWRLEESRPRNTEADFWAFVSAQPAWYRNGTPAHEAPTIQGKSWTIDGRDALKDPLVTVGSWPKARPEPVAEPAESATA